MGDIIRKFEFRYYLSYDDHAIEIMGVILPEKKTGMRLTQKYNKKFLIDEQSIEWLGLADYYLKIAADDTNIYSTVSDSHPIKSFGNFLEYTNE